MQYKKLFQEAIHYNKLYQSGRTLLEQLVVLAIVGILVIGALAGFMYSRRKASADFILSDVSLAYMEASEKEESFGRRVVSFKPESGFVVETERVSTVEGTTDIVIVNEVPESVCRILQTMTETGSYVLLEWSDAVGDYVQLTGCSSDKNEMIFGYGKAMSCDCPDHARCQLTAGCVCDFGYEMSAAGSCEEMVCPVVKEIEDITEEYCCLKAAGLWDGTCYCAEDYYFNGTQCVPAQGFCVYAYEGPTGNGYYADCSYTFREEGGEVSMVIQEACPSGQYCTLRWMDTDCGHVIPAEGAPTIYGRCTGVTLIYNSCRQYEEKIIPTVWVRHPCEDNQYCYFNWSSDTCSPLPVEGANLLYGVCLAFNKTSPLVCPVSE